MAGGFHEDYSRAKEVKSGSNRSFGLVFAAVFALVGLAPLWSKGQPRIWSLAVAGVFLVVALLVPRALAPLNRVWFLFGLLLHRIVSPVILGAIFYVVVTPVALLRRLFGGDSLGRRFEPDAESYWIVRDPPGPEPETMQNQF